MCKTLVILGYSLPETDLLAQALFAEVIRTRAAKKHWLRELHAADPDKNVQDKFIALCTPALYSSGKVFRYSNVQEFSNTL